MARSKSTNICHDRGSERSLRFLNALRGSDSIGLAEQAGVSRRVVRQALQGRAIATEPYLKLCCALGVDAFSGAVRASAARPQARCDWAAFAKCLRAARLRRGHDIRAAATLLAISTA